MSHLAPVIIDGTTLRQLYASDTAFIPYRLSVGHAAVPFTELDLSGTQTYRSVTSPGVAPASQARIYYDGVLGKLRVSENGGAFVDLVNTGGGTITGGGTSPRLAVWSGPTALTSYAGLDWNSGTNTLSTPNLNVGADAVINGNLTVLGTTISVSVQDILVADNHIHINYGYTNPVARPGGLIVNYLPTATTDTVIGNYVAGVAAVSNPTVTTTGAATFSAGDLVEISGGNANNAGIYEVLSHAANLLTVRGVGVTACVENWTTDQFVSQVSDGAVITKVNISVLRAGTDGLWEQGQGSATPLTYADVGTVGGSGSAGAVAFWTGASTLSQDPTQLFWDDVNNRLGVGTATPAADLDVGDGTTNKTIRSFANTATVQSRSTATTGQAVLNATNSDTNAVQLVMLGATNATVGGPRVAGEAYLGTNAGVLNIGSLRATNPSIGFFTGTGTEITEVERARIGNTEFVVNNPGGDYNFRVGSDFDTHALFLDANDGAGQARWGFFDSTPAAKVDINGGTLPDGVPAFNIDATLSPAAAVQYGTTISFTTAGSGAFDQRGLQFSLLAGYTGTGGATNAVRITNSAGSRGTTVLGGGGGGITPVANISVLAVASNDDPTKTGSEAGVYGYGRNSDTRNFGTIGVGYSSVSSSPANIGVYGTAGSTGAGTPSFIGGMFTLYGNTDAIGATTTSAALIADNAAVGATIFLARDNGAEVFAVIAGGALEVAEIAAPSTPAAGFGRIYAKSDNNLYFKNDAGTEILLSGGGSVSGTGSAGAVPYWTGATTLSEDPTQFFWDAANNRLGVGTASPQTTLHVNTGAAPSTSILRLQSSASSFDLKAGSGSPEGVVTGSPGDVLSDPTNGVLYVKKTGVGNTGWSSVASTSGGGAANRMTYWTSASELAYDDDLRWDGTTLWNNKNTILPKFDMSRAGAGYAAIGQSTGDTFTVYTGGGYTPRFFIDNTLVYGSGTGAFRLHNSSTDSDSAPTYAFQSDANTGVRNPAADTLTIVTGGTERVRVDSAGSVSISSTAGEALRSTVSINNNIFRLVNSGGALNKKVWAFETDLLNEKFIIAPNDDAITTYLTYPLVLNRSGNVGIGVNDTTYALRVQSTLYVNESTRRVGVNAAPTASEFEVRNSAGTAGIGFSANSQSMGGLFGTGGNFTWFAEAPGSATGPNLLLGGSTRGDAQKNALVYGVGATEYFRVDGDAVGHTLGNVGIGTSTPSQKLEVVGSTRAYDYLAVRSHDGNVGLYAQNDNNTANASARVQLISDLTGNDVQASMVAVPSGYTAATWGTYSAGKMLLAVRGSTTRKDMLLGAVGSGTGGKLAFHVGGLNETFLAANERAAIGVSEFVVNDPGNDYDFRVEAVGQSAALFVNGADGTIGMGTNSPIASRSLHVTRDAGTIATLSSFTATAGDGPVWQVLRGRGTYASPTGIQSGDLIGQFSYQGMFAAGIGNRNTAARIDVTATENWSITNTGASLILSTVSNGTATLVERMSVLSGETVFNDASGIYNFRVESDGNANMLFVDGTNNRVGIGTNAPGSTFTVVAPSGTANVFSVTSVAPSAASQQSLFDYTGAGTSGPQIGLYSIFRPGFTGSTGTHYTTAFNSINNNRGVGTTPIATTGGDFGVITYTGADAVATTGHRVGVIGRAYGSSTRNFGLIGVAASAAGTQQNIGVFGSSLAGFSTSPIGGMFTMNNWDTDVLNIPSGGAVLIADNNASTVPIFLARDNGVTVFSIADGGNVTIGNVTNNELLTINGRVSLAETTAPTSTSGFGKLWTQTNAVDAVGSRAYFMGDSGSVSQLVQMAGQVEVIGVGGAISLDFAPGLSWNRITGTSPTAGVLTSNPTFSTANLGVGRSMTVFVLGGASPFTPTFPAGWNWLTPVPTTIAANDVGVLTLFSTTAADTGVVAAWSYENAPAMPTGTGTANRVAYWTSASAIAADADLFFDGTNFAVGTTSPTARAHLAGSQARSITTVSADTTLDATHYTVVVDATAAARTITLPPAASSAGVVYVVKKKDSSVNTVTIDGNASETIDGATTYVLSAQYAAVKIHCDGTEWWVTP